MLVQVTPTGVLSYALSAAYMIYELVNEKSELCQAKFFFPLQIVQSFSLFPVAFREVFICKLYKFYTFIMSQFF
jgi:hypothetical protein